MKTQTLVGLPRLALALARPMSDVPNTPGFTLLAILKSNGLAMPVTVVRDFTGLHRLRDHHHEFQPCALFSGWVKDEHAAVVKK